MNLMEADFVIVPCSKSKVWDRNPQAGCVPALHAYTGPVHRMAMRLTTAMNRHRLIPRFILSAKYGLLRASMPVCNYNVSFSSRADVAAHLVVGVDTLRRQLQLMGMGRRGVRVVVLGSRHYARPVREALPDAQVVAPMEGMTQGRMLGWLRQQIDRLEGGKP